MILDYRRRTFDLMKAEKVGRDSAMVVAGGPFARINGCTCRLTLDGRGATLHPNQDCPLPFIDNLRIYHRR